MAIEELKSIDQIRNLMISGMKTVGIRDASGRMEVLYEAHIKSEIGDPCLRTRYKYLDGAAGSSRKVLAYEEEVIAWPGYEAIQAGAGNDFDLLL